MAGCFLRLFLPRGAMGLPAVVNCGIPNHTHYLYSGFGDCNSRKHQSIPGPIRVLGGEVPVI